MDQQTETAHSPHRHYGLARREIAAIAVTAIILLLCLRGGCELSMIWQHGSDAQLAIWWMFCLIKIALWFLTGGLLLGLLLIIWPRRWALIVGLPPLLAWVLAISFASWNYEAGRRALADASDPSTSAGRLSELVDFDGIQAGYELDNRLANNPNTPAEALRKLSKRDQQGTDMCLAHNPHTPPDVLKALADKKD